MKGYPARSVICPIMVGRDLPVQALQRLFEQTRSKHGQVALVSGEAGIGKSRLIRELKAHLPTALILQGNCFEADQTLPYAPIADLLRTFFASLNAPRKSAIIAELGSELIQLLPELTQDYPGAAQRSGDTELEKRRLHQALVQLLAGLSAAQPLLFIIEDIHWCDDASLEFLSFLARRLSGQPLLLLLTYRDDEVGTALDQFLAHLDRERLTTEFRLPRLTVETVGTMVRAIFEMERAPRNEFVDAIYNLSEGNPFFIEEMLKSLVASGDIFITDGKWGRKPLSELDIPRTVQVSLRQRLSQLTTEAQQMLSAAAVAGRHFDFTLLQHLTGIPEIELLRLIRELKDAQFVVEENADTFAFRHALTRQAVYQDLLVRERRALHLAIAEVIEQLYKDNHLAKAHLPDLTYHYYQAEKWEKALEYGLMAGEYAQALYSPLAALEHYGRALDACQQMQIEPPVSLLRAYGKAFEITGDFRAARDAYLRALRTAQKTADRRFKWQSLLDLGFLFTGLDFAQAGPYFQDAIAAARELSDPTAVAKSLNRLGNWYINQDLPVDALPYHLEALTIFETLDDIGGQAETLDLLGVTEVVAGDIVNSAAYYDRAIPLFRQLDHRIGLSSSLAVTCNRGGNCMEETVYCPPTELDVLLRYSDEARQIATDIGWQHGEAAADMYASYGLVLRGEYQLGLAYGQRTMDISTAIDHTLYRAAAQMALGRLYNEIFAFENARDILETGLQTSREISAKFLESSIGGFLVSTYIGLGDMAKAAGLIAELRAEQIQSVGQRIVKCAAAELALVQEEAEQAVELIENLIETAPSSAGHVIPKLWQMKAEALTILGKPDLSLTLLQDAAQETRQREMRGLLWRILVSLGKLELAAGRREQAEDYFDDAHHLIEILADKIPGIALREHFLTRANEMIPEKPSLTSRQAARLAYDGLTEREREIAVLIANGKSSREIAQQLTLSKRTVDAHTANILAKLGFSSRIQIARWAVEKGLV
jgi:DNA-binding CsgD family transcriptional regulator